MMKIEIAVERWSRESARERDWEERDVGLEDERSSQDLEEIAYKQLKNRHI